MARGLHPAPLSVLRQNSSKQQAKITMSISKDSKEATGMEIDSPRGGIGDIMLMLELRQKLGTFRGILDLPPCDDTTPIIRLIMRTLEDLNKLYPGILPNIEEKKEISLQKELSYLYEALKSIGDNRTKSHKLVASPGHSTEGSSGTIHSKQLGGQVIAKLDNMIKAGRRNFDIMYEDKKSSGDHLSEMFSDIKNTCTSPASPTSVPPELMKSGANADVSNSLPPLLQAVEKCISLDIFPVVSFQGSIPGEERKEKVDRRTENFSKAKSTGEGLPIIATNEASTSPKSVINPETNLSGILAAKKPKIAPMPLSPPLFLPPNILSASSNMPFQESVATPPPVPIRASVPISPNMSQVNGNTRPPPPPPAVGPSKFIRLTRSNSKLRRSSHMGNLYRNLKRKLEGSNFNVTTSNKIKSQIVGIASIRQGMADALAEITRRSAYFHQIEEDVQKHSQMIIKIKDDMNSFKTKDMAELLKFHKHVEQNLEELSDETQVLARFEDFPSKKLESLRTAAALHLKLEGIAFNLEHWKIESPLEQLLDKVESFFNKIKGDIEALDRSKDEESKHFKSHDIDFDFNILIRIKELMVDVSSGSMELALKERREATEAKRQAYVKLLWRAFQLAFRVYTFAGGQDDRADRLTKELGRVLDTDPQNP